MDFPGVDWCSGNGPFLRTTSTFCLNQSWFENFEVERGEGKTKAISWMTSHLEEWLESGCLRSIKGALCQSRGNKMYFYARFIFQRGPFASVAKWRACQKKGAEEISSMAIRALLLRKAFSPTSFLWWGNFLRFSVDECDSRPLSRYIYQQVAMVTACKHCLLM